ncbi:cell division ATP-binding protein FtsE [Desulfofarcimen acetoxidans DSM 771]|jgi:cell division transport system ATP-binding protein|uniref:Cell division ATP-binding protein FtsE n=1 Tax=Desulfofarcimen acetoxidans (strain ATCC 49208 / DSM 771 / KCTC 5769 / VKM B-1644 / 5575) TaxID=485916 RepID=C8VY30_DESAS|nr:cell division ATP-binding protein FtsE [Desulfofarcimen acetoxidans]ACV64659.1 cell division ATP-binding protein FtsE [Desulfofarcimen acetoxidans DSM 771]
MIHFYNVTKVYPNHVKAISDITLHISKGEFIFLVGPSGAGKSTICKLLFCEEAASGGQIIFRGKSLSRMKRREVPYHRRTIGMVFQDFRLLPQKTAWENVAFALEVTGAPRRDIKRLVPPVLELVGLLHKADAFPAQLSGGEQQRIGIARAIVNNPLLILADEPTGNLDPDTSWDLMKLFQDINNRGTTIIMSTHDKQIVDTLRKRVIALANGKIARDEERGEYGLCDSAP